VVEKLTAHASLPPTPIRSLRPEVPAGLARLLERMLAKDPAQRYQSPADVARDLAAFEAEAPSVPAESPTHAPTLPLPAVQAAPAPTIAALPESDPLADLDLGSIGSLPPVNRTGKSPGFKFGPAHLTAVLLACGTALAMIILATAFADQLFPDKDAAAKHGKSSGEQPLVQPAVAVALPAAAAKLPKRVLYVIPQRYLFLQDYQDVKVVLEARGIAVDTAATSLDRCTLAASSTEGDVFADFVLDAGVTHDKYGAIVFAGKDTSPYEPGGSHSRHVERLLGEFNAHGKLVAAICSGELVLAAHGQLNNRPASFNRFGHGWMMEKYPGCTADWRQEPVVRDDTLITAGSFEEANDFANQIVAALEGR
jgi:putative intracellular protease/amidase